MRSEVDTVVVGASAAGLAVAAQLQALGRQVELLEAEEAVAGPWRRHYDRLHLHTPKATSALPGLAMPAHWPRYVSREQVVEYLEAYCAHFALRPRFGQAVTRIEPAQPFWEVATADGSWRARHVVVSTGRTRVPVKPDWPGLERFNGEVLHSSDYRNGSRWRGRPVLVVGFGNSACEQALDLAEHGAQAHLAVRSAVNVVRRDVLGFVPVLALSILLGRLPPRLADSLGRPVARLTVGDLEHYGLRRLPYGPMTQIARDGRVPLIDVGTLQAIKAGRIAVHSAIERFGERSASFVDGSQLELDAVVLATGYRAGVDQFLPCFEEVCDSSGTPLVSGVPAARPGLYFCGMRVTAGGMLREIGRESARIAADIAGRRAVLG